MRGYFIREGDCHACSTDPNDLQKVGDLLSCPFCLVVHIGYAYSGRLSQSGHDPDHVPPGSAFLGDRRQEDPPDSECPQCPADFTDGRILFCYHDVQYSLTGRDNGARGRGCIGCNCAGTGNGRYRCLYCLDYPGFFLW